MLVNNNKLMLVAIISSLFAAPVAQATNGYFAHGYSTKEKGLAGAGVAYSQDSLASATNPAGIAFVGERMDLGIALFAPSDRGYTVTNTGGGAAPFAPYEGAPYTAFCAPSLAAGGCQVPFSINAGSVTSENDMFLIPSFGMTWALDSEHVIGFSVYGNGGMDTEYKSGSVASLNPGTFSFDNNLPGTFGSGTVGINLMQAFFNLSLATKTSADEAMGVSLILAAQRFRSFGLEYFGGYSNDPSNLAGNRNSDSKGFGFKLGYQAKVMKDLSVGISYQSKIAMSEFEEYKGLFAENGGFDIPSTYTVGLVYGVGTSGKVVFDVQRINYTEVAAVSNPIENFFGGNCIDPLNAMVYSIPAGGSGCLGGANGAGFGWEDMTVIKLGYEMVAGNNVYRFGYSKADMPIPESQTLFNILAPAVIEQHYTFGMTMPVGKDQEFNLAVMIAPNASVKGANPFDGGATQIELEMEQKEIQVGWAWKY
ncbi:MAG: outer membrane protein transport protein [Gammaproteobacteria bacterium]|nr:outer membrane protein transport protein [Gammaproteobacteria bacterium]